MLKLIEEYLKIKNYKYEKLEAYCKFNSGKVLFFNDGYDLKEIIEKIESGVSEIIETNQFIIPEAIRYKYKTLCKINIFSEVKRIQNDELILINEYEQQKHYFPSGRYVVCIYATTHY